MDLVNERKPLINDQLPSTSTSVFSPLSTRTGDFGKDPLVTKLEDKATNNGKKSIDVDALLKKLEEDDKILKELEELEKKDRLTCKKLSVSTANTSTATACSSTSTTTSTYNDKAKSTSSTIASANITLPTLFSPSTVTTVSKSTCTEKETQYTSPSPPPAPSTQSFNRLPSTTTTATNTVSTKSVSTSTTSTNTSSIISEQVSSLSDFNSSSPLSINRFGQLSLAPYGIGLSAIGGGGVAGNLSSSMPSLIDHQQALQLLSSHLHSRPPGSSISPHELEKLMEKLEHDNRILAELDQKVKRISSSSSNISSPVFLSSSLPTLTGIAHPGLLSTLYPHLFQSMVPDRNILTRDKRLMLQNNSSYFDDDIEQIQLLQALIKNQQQELQFAAEDIADCIEIPNRGRCRVFIARYSYDPYKQSPNDNPEAELHLAAGDFILVFGDMDEDGFYFGELLDGRRGLVPCNFVEKLVGEDLFEFQTSVLYEGRDGDESTCSYPPEFYDAILDDVIGHSNFQHLLAPEDFHRMNDYIELCESSDIDEEDLSDPERAQANAAKDPVPPPKRLILERQLHKSILLGWLPPDCPRSYIDNYQIYVDGVLKVTVPSNERTRALVEGVDSSIPHRISVRAITPQGRASRDAACTIVIGKKHFILAFDLRSYVPFAPSCVKATNITATSALISWLPSNSNFYHVVAVNSVEVKTVGSSTYKNLITGLSPNTMYRVSVRAKPGKLLCSEEKNPKKLEMLTTFVDFRTLPKSLPEPPVDVQIESGPQDGTLLVTWLPVTLDQFGTSNGCPVTGYAVFSAHKKLAEIDSPTSDHALLDISQIESFHKKAITVRTKSGENLSQDSISCQVPEELIKLNNNNLRKGQNDSPAMRGIGMAQNKPRMIQASSQSNQMQMQQQHQGLRHQNTLQQQKFHQQQPRNLLQQQHHPNPNQQQHTINRNMNQMNPQGAHNQQTVNFQNTQANSSNQSNMPIVNKGGQKPFQNTGNRPNGPSPQPPQRNRQYTDHERSHFGQGRGAIGPSGPQSRMMGPNRQQHQQQSQQQQQQRDIRHFVALYDYDPLTMSPNPDAANEELPFREGDIIKIYGDKDPDGFYRGELHDRVGFVPCNMVSEVQYDPETGAPLRVQGGGSGGSNVNDPWAHLPVKKMIALYDYDPQELSPNPDTEMELAFRAGDHIYVYGDLDEDGFYMGELNGNRGLVPSNFLTEAIDGTSRHASQNQGNRGPTIGDSRPLSQQTQHIQQLSGQTGYQPLPHQQQQSSINHNQHHQQQQLHQQRFQSQQHQQQFQQSRQNQQQQQQPSMAHQQPLTHHSQGQQGYGQHQFQVNQQQTLTSNNQKLPMTNTNISQQQVMRPQGNFGNQQIYQSNPNHPHHHQQQQLGPQQRPNSLELRSNQGMASSGQQVNQIGRQQFQQNQQQQQQQQQKMLSNQMYNQNQQQPVHQHTTNSLNPLSNLLNTGKQMLAEATTPRTGQPPSNFDSHSQMIHNSQHGQLNQMNQQETNRINSVGQKPFQTQQQGNYQQGQQNYSQQPQQTQLNNNKQFNYNTNTGSQGPMIGLMSGQGQLGQAQNQQAPTLSGALGAVKSIFKI